MTCIGEQYDRSIAREGLAKARATLAELRRVGAEEYWIAWAGARVTLWAGHVVRTEARVRELMQLEEEMETIDHDTAERLRGRLSDMQAQILNDTGVPMNVRFMLVEKISAGVFSLVDELEGVVR